MKAETRLRAVIALLLLFRSASLAGLRPKAVRPRPRVQRARRGLQAPGPVSPPQGVREDQSRLPEHSLSGSHRGQHPDAKVALATTLDDVLALQRDFLAGGQGPVRLQKPVAMAVQLLNHPLLESLITARSPISPWLTGRPPLGRVRPGFLRGDPPDQRDFFKTNILSAVELLTARPISMPETRTSAMASIEADKKSGGATGGNYFYVPAASSRPQASPAEAIDAYLAAAAEEYNDAAAKARALYVQVHGSDQGFEAARATSSRRCPSSRSPSRPLPPGRARPSWPRSLPGPNARPASGPTWPSTPHRDHPRRSIWPFSSTTCAHSRPDPMMNPAGLRGRRLRCQTARRPVIDGTNKSSAAAGEARPAASSPNIGARSSRFCHRPRVSLKARATLAGDKRSRSPYDFDKTVPGAEYLLVLVQGEQEHLVDPTLSSAFHKRWSSGISPCSTPRRR